MKQICLQTCRHQTNTSLRNATNASYSFLSYGGGWIVYLMHQCTSAAPKRHILILLSPFHLGKCLFFCFSCCTRLSLHLINFMLCSLRSGSKFLLADSSVLCPVRNGAVNRCRTRAAHIAAIYFSSWTFKCQWSLHVTKADVNRDRIHGIFILFAAHLDNRYHAPKRYLYILLEAK